MSQHTYALKFTIKAAYTGESANLDMVMNEGGDTLEDIIKTDVEKRIREAIPQIRGAANVVFDELTESE